MAFFFTADTHFGDKNILRHGDRVEFLSPEEREGHDKGEILISQESVNQMDDLLLENINRYVGANDILWHLGDFGSYRHSYQVAQTYRNRIRCQNIYFIWGNHDNRHWEKLFQQTHGKYILYLEHVKIILTHCAHAVWEYSHTGSWNLYGHSHSTAEPWLDKYMPDRLSIDVGVDNAVKVLGEYRPFSLRELEDIFYLRKGCSIDTRSSEVPEVTVISRK